MNYTGMLCLKGVLFFSGQRYGRGSLFKERYVKGVLYQGKVFERGKIFRVRYVKEVLISEI